MLNSSFAASDDLLTRVDMFVMYFEYISIISILDKNCRSLSQILKRNRNVI